jgi:hypothetical protein
VAKTVHEHWAETLGQTMSEVGLDNVREFQTLLSRFGLCPIGGLWKHDFYPKSTPFFSTLILEL